jgi:16S rRNA processing protein RimM
VVGEVAGAHGIKGWVKIHSHTEPPEQILDYAPWTVEIQGETKEYEVVAARAQGRQVIAQLQGVTDRDQAAALRFGKIMVPRTRFPELEAGHYYWVDLVGLRVRTPEGVLLGRLDEMMATGANDVMVVRGERERLIPFVMGDFVKEVNLKQGYLTVDWDPAF